VTDPRPTLDPGAVDGLLVVLGRARSLGFLGPGPSLDDQIDHALGFARALGSKVPPPGRALDLGSGGGLPGLVLAALWPGSHWLLLDANQRRTDGLIEAVDELGMADRVVVERARAEESAHDERWRQAFDLVTSRSFGRPAAVAECGAGFLKVGGILVVSEPMDDPEHDRWPAAELQQLGLVPLARAEAGYRSFELTVATPPSFPRRVGMPGKRPLF
jgi:16S rRNA (guanine527-N7)-methyltransferase